MKEPISRQLTRRQRRRERVRNGINQGKGFHTFGPGHIVRHNARFWAVNKARVRRRSSSQLPRWRR